MNKPYSKGLSVPWYTDRRKHSPVLLLMAGIKKSKKTKKTKLKKKNGKA